jgi:hypothetical protein
VAGACQISEGFIWSNLSIVAWAFDFEVSQMQKLHAFPGH